MGEQIVTQYENYQELLLDLDIFGRLSSTKQMNLDEYKDLFFEEFKKQKPMPTMESKRYELSRLVDNSYRVEYNRQLELRENERLVDFNEELEDENVENKTNRKLEDIDIDNNVKILFQYENQVCDRDREEIIKKYSLENGELLQGVRPEKLMGTIKEDESLKLDDIEIENLGAEVPKFHDEEFEPIEDYEETKESTELDEVDDFDAIAFSDDVELADNFEDEETEEIEESDSDFDDDIEDDFEEEENEESDEDFEETEEESNEGFDEDLEEIEEESNEGSDEDLEETEEESNDDLEDEEEFEKSDVSEDTEESEEEFKDSDDESDVDYEEEPKETDDNEENFDDSDEEYEPDDNNLDKKENTSDLSVEQLLSMLGSKLDTSIDLDKLKQFVSKSDNSVVPDSVEPELKNDIDIKEVPIEKEQKQDSLDDFFDNDTDDLSEFFEEKKGTETNELSKKNQFFEESSKETDKKEETISEKANSQQVQQQELKEPEPTDLRTFIRKHPRCDYDFATQYFTPKQIAMEIKKGRVIKKGNMLKI